MAPIVAFPLAGMWRPGQVSVGWVPSTRPVIAHIEEMIECAWQRAMARPGVHLFDGPMCRLESLDLPPEGTLRLSLSRTSYKPFIGTNLNDAAALAACHGRSALANPVGLSAVLISGDGRLLLGRRTANVAYYPSRVHPFAGALEPDEHLDVFDDIRREFHEELALAPTDLSDLVCTGIAEDQTLLQPELIFAARTRLSHRQIESQLDPGEHHALYSTPATPEGIESALRSGERFTPVAIGAMLLWARLEFGQAFADRVLMPLIPPARG